MSPAATAHHLAELNAIARRLYDNRMRIARG